MNFINDYDNNEKLVKTYYRTDNKTIFTINEYNETI
ncbi:DUF2963 domain-containing protein [Candidatus Phytoplasma sp. AldY-WA1]